VAGCDDDEFHERPALFARNHRGLRLAPLPHART
jgi:hypothetical protein